MIKVKYINGGNKVGYITDETNIFPIGSIHDAIDTGDGFQIKGNYYFKWRFVIVNFNDYLEML